MDTGNASFEIKPVNRELFKVAEEHLDNLTKPQGSLGRLEECAKRLVAIYGKETIDVPKKIVFTFAGDHGVVEEGVSAYPAEVTQQMVYNFLSGGAAINVLARHAGAEVVVIDIGVNHDFPEVEGLVKKKVVYGTRNITTGPAMTKEETIRCIETGIELAHTYAGLGYRLFAAGEMGIANTTPSSAIAAVITGSPVPEVTGRGTGITEEGLKNKIRIIEKAIAANNPDSGDPLDVLAKVGGAEIGGIAGLCIGAAEKGVPVIVDGFISSAGAIVANSLENNVADYLFAAHLSQERGHRKMLEYMGLHPLLELDLRLGEGTGAALAMLILDAGVKIFREMATFQEAGVSKNSR